MLPNGRYETKPHPVHVWRQKEETGGTGDVGRRKKSQSRRGTGKKTGGESAS